MLGGFSCTSATLDAAPSPSDELQKVSTFQPDTTNLPTLKINPRDNSRELEGQVFVVLNGGQALKLALVKVAVYPASYFSAYNEWKNTNFNHIAVVLGSQFDARNYDAFSKVMKLAMSRWEYLASSTARATTDADGKFKLSINFDGPVVVFARVSRSTGRLNETYTWAVPMEITREHDTLLLTNDNLLSESGWVGM